MKIGACVGANAESMRIIKKIGFDYAEGHSQDIVKKPMEYIEEMKATGIPMLAANCFIGLRVVGEERDDEKIKEYLEELFKRGAYLGIKYFVFGSSGARRIPDGMTLEEGRAQIVDFLKRLVVPVAEKYNIRVAIEPLRPAECNAINTVATALRLPKRLIRLMSRCLPMSNICMSKTKISTFFMITKAGLSMPTHQIPTPTPL